MTVSASSGAHRCRRATTNKAHDSARGRTSFAVPRVSCACVCIVDRRSCVAAALLVVMLPVPLLCSTLLLLLLTATMPRGGGKQVRHPEQAVHNVNSISRDRVCKVEGSPVVLLGLRALCGSCVAAVYPVCSPTLAAASLATLCHRTRTR